MRNVLESLDNLKGTPVDFFVVAYYIVPLIKYLEIELEEDNKPVVKLCNPERGEDIKG